MMKMPIDWSLMGHIFVVSAIVATAFVFLGDGAPADGFLGEPVGSIAQFGE